MYKYKYIYKIPSRMIIVNNSTVDSEERILEPSPSLILEKVVTLTDYRASSRLS